MEELSRIFKILSDLNRLRIIALLSERKMCVCELAFVLGVTQPSVSRHLKMMKEAGIIADEKDRFWTNYFIRCDDLRAKTILEYLRKWLKEDSLFLEDLRKLEGVDRANICCC